MFISSQTNYGCEVLVALILHEFLHWYYLEIACAESGNGVREVVSFGDEISERFSISVCCLRCCDLITVCCPFKPYDLAPISSYAFNEVIRCRMFPASIGEKDIGIRWQYAIMRIKNLAQ